MNHFPEIIRILERFREPRIETLDGDFRSNIDDKSFLLYDGIRKGEFKNDQAAAAAIYQASSIDARYATLKSRLKWRLFNTLFHLNPKRAGFSEYANATYTVNRRAFLTQTLLTLGARSIGIKLAQRTLRDALKYEFSLIAFNMAFNLRLHASLMASASRYEHYDKIVKEQLRIITAETESWEFYERAQAVGSNRQDPGEQFVQNISESIEALSRWLPNVSSMAFLINYYRLQIMLMKARGQQREIVTVADNALHYLDTVPHLTHPARKAEFHLARLEAFTILQDYSNALDAVERCATLFPAGSNNWFSFKQREFQLLMLSKQFIKAESLFTEVVQHERFGGLPEIWRERWTIFELYLQYALQTMPEYESLPLRKKFDLQGFLRFIPVASKDKHGMHMAVLVIHILYLLQIGDFSGIINRMDALRSYRTRYLRGKLHQRSRLFFRLLAIMENNSFNYTLIRQKSERTYKLLLAESLDLPETNEELQIIPYEWLWERALETLKDYEEGRAKSAAGTATRVQHL